MEYRLGRADDLAACKAVLVQRQPDSVDPALLPDLERLWAQLLDEERILFHVVTEAGGGPLAGFHMSAFVHERVALALRGARQAGIAGQLLACHRDGESVFLEASEIAARSAERRLNVVSLHCLVDAADLASARAQAIVAASGNGFFFTHTGYGVARFIEEVFDDQFAAVLTASGIGPWDEYDANGAGEPRPRLHGLRAEQVAPVTANPLSALFHSPPPRFYFTPAEQRVLIRALLDASDVEIAADLGVSVSAVRQAWRGIFQRIAAVKRELLGPDGIFADSENSARGREKRRKVLAYLRQHPQELRPFKNGVRGPATETGGAEPVAV